MHCLCDVANADNSYAEAVHSARLDVQRRSKTRQFPIDCFPVLGLRNFVRVFPGVVLTCERS